MNESHEFRGKNVDDAVTTGLTELGLRRDQVEIQVISEGSRGIFGLGSEPAIVRLMPHSVQADSAADEVVPVTPSSDAPLSDAPEEGAVEATHAAAAEDEVVAKAPESASTVHDFEGAPEAEEEPDEDDEAATDSTPRDAAVDDIDDADISDDDLADMASDMLAEMISLMGFDAEIEASWKDPEPGENESCLMLDVRGSELSTLIGRQGETLSSIQYLLRLMVNQRLRAWKNIVVDVEQYKARRADQLMKLALRMADQVVESDRALSLEPMPSNERRVIHLALRDHAHVYTESSGDGERRKVHIIPKRMLD